MDEKEVKKRGAEIQFKDMCEAKIRLRYYFHIFK